MINVTVIGFGYVGSALSFLLLNSKHDICLNIMDPNPDCEGAFLDLVHTTKLYQQKKLYLNNEELLLQADFIYYAAGISNKHGSSRLSTANENIRLSKEIFWQRKFTKSPHIIVITNPVDLISHAIFQYTNLPAEKVVGIGTFLDSERLAYYLSTQSEFGITDFETVVLGEHGDTQVPVYSMCKVRGLPILSHPMFSTKVLENTTKLTKNAAFQIRETQDATMYGVSVCAMRLLDYLLSKEEYSITLSMLTNKHYRSLLLLKKNIYISVPVIIKNGLITINNKVDLLEEELNAYRKSASVLAAANKLDNNN